MLPRGVCGVTPSPLLKNLFNISISINGDFVRFDALRNGLK